MENYNQDIKASETSKHDHISETYTMESARNPAKKKSERLRKEEVHRVESFSLDLIAIGKSCCGRWVKFQKTLGEGGYKTVFKGYDSEKGTNVAWCEFKPRHVDTKEKQVNMMKEIEIMVKMDHPNIVACYDIFDEYIDLRISTTPVNVKSIILIEELLGEGTLKSVIKKNFINGQLILEYSLVLYWLHQIIDALTYMHEKLNPPIIHRDLKADNCFLESKSSDKCLNVKVGDFGLAKQVDNKEKNTMLGTVGFMAPEVYEEKYDVKVDIYAFGMLMLEVLTNRTPYDDCETVMQVAKQTMSGKMPELFSLITDPWTREVISCCIHPLPAYRPTAVELYFHPLFSHSYDSELKNILPIEITPNSDNCTDRETIINNFVANIVQENGTYNTKFNLRMEFRNKRIQKSFNLDEGESLEFDLDVFKQEDIPELISNLKSEYQDNLRQVLNSNKNLDTKAINTQLDKFFKSMEIQMNFLLKMILGKRWHFILDTFLAKQKDPELKDDVSGFSLLASYKKNWMNAINKLEAEIANYQKLDKNVENVKPSRVYKSFDFPKLDSVSMNQFNFHDEKNFAGFGQNSTNTKMKQPNDFNNYQNQLHNTFIPNQPFIYPYNYMPSFMNSCGYQSEASSCAWHMLNFPQNPVPMNQVGYDIWPDDNSRNVDTKSPTNLKSSTISKSASKSKKGSNSEKISRLKKQFKDGLVDKIFTFEEIMAFISTKLDRKSRHPFMIIPVNGQSNAFRLIKMNDIELTDNKTVEESPENKDFDSQPKSSRSRATRHLKDTEMYNQNIYSHPSLNVMPINSNPLPNNPYSIQVPNNLYSFSNPSSDPLSMQHPYLVMQNWIQQQNLFQQQIFQQQQQQLFLQQQQLNYQQQLQRRMQQQQIQRKMNFQSSLNQPFDNYNKQPSTSADFFQEEPDIKLLNQNGKKKFEPSVPKFVVKKIDESLKMSSHPTKTDSPTISLDENRTTQKSDQKILKDKKEKKTKENNCNLEILDPEKEIISELSINDQGEHSTKLKVKENADYCNLINESLIKSASCQTFNILDYFENEMIDTAKGPATINEIFKFPSQKVTLMEDETLKDSSSIEIVLSKTEIAISKLNDQQNFEVSRLSSSDFTSPFYEI